MNVVSYNTKREEALLQKKTILKEWEGAGNSLKGEMKLTVTGEKGKRLFTSELFNTLSKKPQGEMSVNELKALVKQAVVDISSEMQAKPPLYKEIYEEIKDSSFPASLEVKDVIGMQSAFGIVGDGEAVPLAEFKVEDMGTVRFKTYATGYSITEEWVAFNQFWKIEMANKMVGQAHNAILDHIHFAPIISATYDAKAKTAKQTVTGGTALQNVYESIRKGLKDAMGRRTARGDILRPSVVLCNSATAMDIQSAVKGETEKGKMLGTLGMIEKIIAYDGWQGKVNGVEYKFDAPKNNVIYLIEPKRGFKALVKKEVTRVEQKGNILRLGNLDVVEFFMRAFVADVANSVHEVTVA